jgi:ribosomal protein L37AE/L43A
MDHATMVERDGASYCCNNCASMSMDRAGQAGVPACAHCQVPIVDTSTEVSREGMTFCCINCATAMTTGVTSRST